jgi:hypothetical protein
MLILAIAGATVIAQESSKANEAYIGNASRVLAREYTSPDISYLLRDIRTGAMVGRGWSDIEQPIPAGSLVKPFTAVAYAESHNFRFPELTCAGGNACWNPAGHGRLTIERAIALSCNSYFTQMALQVSAIDVAKAGHAYGLSGPGALTSADGLVGRYGEWRESPRAIVHAYAELLDRRLQPGVREIVRGMAESAKSGTAVGASRSVPEIHLLAKTGTAPCTHSEQSPGDGFVVLAWPAETPHYILLVRQHGVPGAHAAILAGKMLRSLEPE